MTVDAAELMLEKAVAGLPPVARARKLEAIGIAMAKRFAALGARKQELFWLERAKEAGNEADRLRRALPTSSTPKTSSNG